MAKTTKGSIPVPHSLATQHVKFSFRHLDTENPKYSLQKCCVEFFSRLVRALARYSSFTVEEFRNQDNKDGRHSHYFPHTSEPDGFTCLNDPEGLEMEEPWQIKLCPEIHELRIPMMSISHSDLMPIRSERSDAGSLSVK